MTSIQGLRMTPRRPETDHPLSLGILPPPTRTGGRLLSRRSAPLDAEREQIYHHLLDLIDEREYREHVPASEATSLFPRPEDYPALLGHQRLFRARFCSLMQDHLPRGFPRYLRLGRPLGDFILLPRPDLLIYWLWMHAPLNVARRI